MANKLLGVNNPAGQAEQEQSPPEFRSFLYHQTEEPKIFCSQADYDAAIKEGWRDTPFPAPVFVKEPPEDLVKSLQDALAKAEDDLKVKESQLEAAMLTIDELEKKVADFEAQAKTIEELEAQLQDTMVLLDNKTKKK
jgi:hypothetical protein